MTNRQQQIWGETPWGPGEGKVVYGMAYEHPVAYDCFDRMLVTNYNTYIVGDSDSGALEVAATLLGRYAAGAEARTFVVDYAGTDRFDFDKTSSLTIPVCPRPDGDGFRMPVDYVPDLMSIERIHRQLGPATEERMKAVNFRFRGLYGREKAEAAVTALKSVSIMSQDKPAIRYVVLITGFDQLVADAGGEEPIMSALGEVLRNGRAHRFSVWMMSDRIPEPAEELLPSHWIWDYCATKLLFPMSAEDAVWCDGRLALSEPRFTEPPIVGAPLVQAIARCGREAAPGRFALVLRGMQSANIVVDGI